MPIHFGRDRKIIRSPFLIARGFFGIGGKSIRFDALDRNARNILKGNMQHRMFRHRSMTITHHPLLMEFGRGLIAQLSGNITERFRRTRSFGKSYRDGLRAKGARRQQINFTFWHMGLLWKIWQIIPLHIALFGGRYISINRATHRSPDFQHYDDSTVSFIRAVIVIPTISDMRYNAPKT